jgi:transposase
MAYRYGDRIQIALFPAAIEDYVAQDSPVRAYDAIVDAFDFNQLGIELDKNKVGNSKYDPKTMLKLLIYSCSYGIKSSRKMERACYDNVSFIWLMGGLKPDHKTISEFRKNNVAALKTGLKQTARICIKLGLCDGNILFVDGSKFRANASKEKIRSKKWCEQKLAQLDERIEQLLAECEQADDSEADQESHAKMGKQLVQTNRLKDRIQAALSQMQEKKLQKINITDPDCELMKGRQGSHSSYNVQSVVDGKEGIIVSVQAVTEKNDLNQFSEQIQNAMQVTGKKCEASCGDAGYCNIDDLAKIDEQHIHVVVPSKRQATHGPLKPFGKSEFVYDEQSDCYYCPIGNKLPYGGVNNSKQASYYEIESKQLCLECIHFGKCTKSKYGRRITRYANEKLRQRFEMQYEQSQDIYARRKQRVELPFGHMKRNLEYGSFLLRGLHKVQAEISLISSCFNITRMIGKLGVQRLITYIMAIKTAQPV